LEPFEDGRKADGLLLYALRKATGHPKVTFNAIRHARANEAARHGMTTYERRRLANDMAHSFMANSAHELRVDDVDMERAVEEVKSSSSSIGSSASSSARSKRAPPAKAAAAAEPRQQQQQQHQGKLEAVQSLQAGDTVLNVYTDAEGTEHMMVRSQVDGSHRIISRKKG
jgi:hypothetical protein